MPPTPLTRLELADLIEANWTDAYNGQNSAERSREIAQALVASCANLLEDGAGGSPDLAALIAKINSKQDKAAPVAANAYAPGVPDRDLATVADQLVWLFQYGSTSFTATDIPGANSLRDASDLKKLGFYTLDGDWNQAGNDTRVYLQALEKDAFSPVGILRDAQGTLSFVEVDVAAGTATPVKVDAYTKAESDAQYNGLLGEIDSVVNDFNSKLGKKASKQDIADLIGAAPAALDTLAEIAAQLLADEQGVAAMLAVINQHTQQLAAKLDADKLRQVVDLATVQALIAASGLTAGASYTVAGAWNGSFGGVALLAGSRNAFQPLGFISDSRGSYPVIANVQAGTYELLEDYIRRVASGGGGGITPEQLATVATTLPATTERTADYTLQLADAGAQVPVNVAVATTIIIPADADVAFAVGTILEICQEGPGQLTVVGASGVTVEAPNNALKTSGQYTLLAVRKKAANRWRVQGGTS